MGYSCVLSCFLFWGLCWSRAQERWQQLTGAAEAYAVDLESLKGEGGVWSARILRRDVGGRTIVQHVQVRCATNQLRTVEEETYLQDSPRPLPRARTGTYRPDRVA